MSEYNKPLPEPSAISKPFWEAAARHELRLQRCEACGKFIYFPRPRCPECFSDRLSWQRCSGRGKVHSYTVVRFPVSRAFAGPPWVLAIVELEEGPHMTTEILAPPERVRVDMPVTAAFTEVAPGHTLVKFKPAG
jgi:uncharacterized protein